MYIKCYVIFQNFDENNGLTKKMDRNFKLISKLRMNNEDIRRIRKFLVRKYPDYSFKFSEVKSEENDEEKLQKLNEEFTLLTEENYSQLVTRKMVQAINNCKLKKDKEIYCPLVR